MSGFNASAALRLQPVQMKACGVPVQQHVRSLHLQREEAGSAPAAERCAANADQQQQQQQEEQSQQAEARPQVLAFATTVAQLLARHIANNTPSWVASGLAEQLKQQVSASAAEAAAAGRTFSMTAVLEQLLPQLSTAAALATHNGHGMLSPAQVGSSTGGTGHFTRFDLPAAQQLLPAAEQLPQQQQQQQRRHLQACAPSCASHDQGQQQRLQQQHGADVDNSPAVQHSLPQEEQAPSAAAGNSPMPAQANIPMRLSAALLNLHNSSVGTDAAGLVPAVQAAAGPVVPAAAAAAAAPATLQQPSWQQQQQESSWQQHQQQDRERLAQQHGWGSMSVCSECGSSCD